MSRIGPFTALLVALVLLVVAELPQLLPGLLLIAGVRPDAVSGVALSLGVGLAVVAAGLILLGLAWLLRISRIEAAWAPALAALQRVADTFDQQVRVDLPRGMGFVARLGGRPVEIQVVTVGEGRVRLSSPVAGGVPFLVQPRGQRPIELARHWSVVAKGASWELRTPFPREFSWVASDRPLISRLEHLVEELGVERVLCQGSVVELELGCGGSEALARGVARGIESWSVLVDLRAITEDASVPRR